MSARTYDRRRNEGAGPFSTQPFGPQLRKISASLARPAPNGFGAGGSLLQIRPNFSRPLPSHTGYRTLVCH